MNEHIAPTILSFEPEMLRDGTARYVRCSEADIPAAVRFDVPRRCEGQTVEVAYGTFSRSEAAYGDPFMREIDRSVGPGAARYYRLVRSDNRG